MGAIFTWTIIEPGAYFIAACLPALRPLADPLARHLARISPRLLGSRAGSWRGRWSGRFYREAKGKRLDDSTENGVPLQEREDTESPARSGDWGGGETEGVGEAVERGSERASEVRKEGVGRRDDEERALRREYGF